MDYRHIDKYVLIIIIGIFIIYSAFKFDYDHPIAVIISGVMTMILGIVLKKNHR